MGKIFLILLLIHAECLSAQIEVTKGGGALPISDSIKIGGLIKPTMYLNGSLLKLDAINTINGLQKNIGLLFTEGDSLWAESYYGGYNMDTSLMRRYFGKERDRGIVFIFTQDKVQDITQKKFEQCLKKEKCKMLFKIDNEPLTDSYHKVDIDKIQMIKNFSLTHWDTGAADTFTLFVIKSKK